MQQLGFSPLEFSVTLSQLKPVYRPETGVAATGIFSQKVVTVQWRKGDDEETSSHLRLPIDAPWDAAKSKLVGLGCLGVEVARHYKVESLKR
jgi:hypothetical protein